MIETQNCSGTHGRFKTVSTQHVEEEYKSSASQSGDEPQANVKNEALGYWIKEDSKSISKKMQHNITKKGRESNIGKATEKKKKKKKKHIAKLHS